MNAPATTRSRLATLATLADPQRLAIVEALAREEQCTCHLVARLGLTQPAVSYHLRLLREHGLVRGERRGRFTFYALVDGALDDLAEELRALGERARSAGTAPACAPGDLGEDAPDEQRGAPR